MSEKPKAQNKAARYTATFFKGILLLIGRLFATFIMVGVITGCIVGSVLTVYVLQMMGADEEIDLKPYELGYTTIMYYIDPETKEEKELQRMYNPDNNRIWKYYDEISEYAKQAIVAVEDQRFWTHQGVDWKRTIGAGVGLFMPMKGTTSGGGSTITQQLIKNITNDKAVRVDRKVREIFRAINLSKRYSQQQILEAYLNVVPFGNGTNGIESAANVYFGKEAIDLSLAEAAAIVGITQYPGYYNPFVYPENNKERQEYVLSLMLEQKMITQEQHDEAVKEKLNFKKTEHQQTVDTVQSYFVDYVVDQVINDLIEQKGYEKSHATKMFYEGGYKIYTTLDPNVQTHLENIYQNTDAFPPVLNADYPQSACVITDINGKVLGMVGGIGEKEGARVLNRATSSKRQPGSSIKPLATYASAFEYNMVTWSTIVEDSQINIANPGEPEKWWPVNYYAGFRGPVTIDYAIRYSVNTVAAKIMLRLTPETAFNFLKNSLNFHSLIERETINGSVSSDMLPAPMTLGALTYGVTPLEMAGGYQIFANGGNFTPPYAYTKVTDSNDRIILKADTTPTRVIAEDTAVLMNKLLQGVIKGPGTGTAAYMGTVMPAAGKTGTSDEDVDQWFMGVTPYYVCQVWLGYDTPQEWKVNPNTGVRELVTNKILYNTYGPPILWKTIMLPLSEKQEYTEFMESPDVVSRVYCMQSGDLAAPSCTQVATGWYKKSRLPNTCTGHREAPSTDDDDDDDDDSSSSRSRSEASAIDITD